jgi:hypothetical protein
MLPEQMAQYPAPRRPSAGCGSMALLREAFY